MSGASIPIVKTRLLSRKWFAVACLMLWLTACNGGRLNSSTASSADAQAPVDQQSVNTDQQLPQDGSADLGRDQLPEFATLSEKYPGDQWALDDPAIIFASDFENGLANWDISSYTGDTAEAIESGDEAHAGTGSMKLSFTLTDLQAGGDASIRATTVFGLPADGYYVRYYMRYTEGTARPHHANSTMVHAPDAYTGGNAGQRPDGDQRFNTAIDIDEEGRFYFYTYWHEMRSWMCNDGSTDPECVGYNGPSDSPYYGNNFKPADQPVVDRYQWNCYEYFVRANTPNEYDGELALWVNGQRLGEFKTGEPMGAWLRANFYTMGEWGTDDNQVPFEGFNFRTSATVNQVRMSLLFYQEWRTLNVYRTDTPTKSEEQAVFYDDVVVATQRIGCR